MLLDLFPYEPYPFAFPSYQLTVSQEPATLAITRSRKKT